MYHQLNVQQFYVLPTFFDHVTSGRSSILTPHTLDCVTSGTASTVAAGTHSTPYNTHTTHHTTHHTAHHTIPTHHSAHHTAHHTTHHTIPAASRTPTKDTRTFFAAFQRSKCPTHIPHFASQQRNVRATATQLPAHSWWWRQRVLIGCSRAISLHLAVCVRPFTSEDQRQRLNAALQIADPSSMLAEALQICGRIRRRLLLAACAMLAAENRLERGDCGAIASAAFLHKSWHKNVHHRLHNRLSLIPCWARLIQSIISRSVPFHSVLFPQL
jgi:hypothetical protein